MRDVEAGIERMDVESIGQDKFSLNRVEWWDGCLGGN